MNLTTADRVRLANEIDKDLLESKSIDWRERDELLAAVRLLRDTSVRVALRNGEYVVAS